MGVLLKSAIGLSAVYFAMFAPALHTADIRPTADACGAAAQAQIVGQASLGAQMAAARCALKLAAQAQRFSTAPPAIPALSSAKAFAPPPAPVAATKSAAGTLTEADLAAPWFGPTHASRKSTTRG